MSFLGFLFLFIPKCQICSIVYNLCLLIFLRVLFRSKCQYVSKNLTVLKYDSCLGSFTLKLSIWASSNFQVMSTNLTDVTCFLLIHSKVSIHVNKSKMTNQIKCQFLRYSKYQSKNVNIKAEKRLPGRFTK